jgi:hypothetical protein
MNLLNEIHGFGNPGELNGRGEIYGGKRFWNSHSGETWHVIPPDPPFRGLLERVHKTLRS